MTDQTTTEHTADMPFEAALAELERVVGQLESGDVPLDRSIALYERGAALKKRCEEELRRAEEKIALITEAEPGVADGARAFDPEA